MFFVVLLLFLGACKNTPGLQGNAVKIVLDTEEVLPDQDTIYLTGNHEALGSWNPKGLAMTRRAETRWEKTFRVPKNTHLEFKFTLGSFEREAISNYGLIPDNSQLDVNEDKELYFVLEDWKNLLIPPRVSKGTVQLHMVSPHNGLAARKVTVWLPDEYATAPDRRFPVIYLHDGQNQFDSTQAFNGQEWKIDETVSRLSAEHKIQAPICVAIDNTFIREEEYGITTKESPYADFVTHQLKPMIDSLYRTFPDRAHTATMGASLGGLVAFHLAWYHDDVFSGAACLSPAFKYKQINLAAELKKYDGPKKDIRLYIDNGTAGLEAELQPGIDEVMTYLKAAGYPVLYQIEKGAVHNENAWARRTERPLVLFFGINQ